MEPRPAGRAGRVLGIATEHQDRFAAELSAALAAAAARIGLVVTQVSSAADEAGVDTLVAIGHPHYYPDLLRRRPESFRVLWYGEPLPPPRRPAVPSRVLRALPWHRLLDLLLPGSEAGGQFRPVVRLRRLRDMAANEREWKRNARSLRRSRGAFDRIVFTSRDRVTSAAAMGIEGSAVPFGYEPAMAGPIVPADESVRDIQILVLGTDSRSGSRRARVLRRVCDELRGDHDVVIVESGTYGAERHALLRRASLVLDIQRIAGSAPTIRFVLAAAAGAAVLSEPTTEAEPLVPGVHFVEAPVPRLADEARDLLSDTPRRHLIVAASQTLLRGPLSMERAVTALADGSNRAGQERQW